VQLSLLNQSRSPLSGYPRRLIRDSARIAPPGAIFDRKRRASYWPLGQWAIANFARHDDWPSPHEQFARSLGKSPRRSDRSLDMLDYGPIEHFPRYLLTIAHCGHAWAANPIPRPPAAAARKLELRRQLKNPESESLGVLLVTQGGA